MLKLRIVSPESVAYNGEAESVKVPGILGNCQVRGGGSPLLSDK